MKKIVLILSFFLSVSVLKNSAQTGVPMLSFEGLEKKLEKSNEDIQNEKKNVKAKTWFQRGELFQDIADVNTQMLRPEMASTEVKLYYKEPKEIRKKENPETGVVEDIYIYPRVELTFVNDKLKSWKETEVIHDEPFKMAIEAYEKADELDPDGKLNDDIKENLVRMKQQLESRAIAAFGQKNYDKAFKYFQLYTVAGEMPVFEGQIDTVVYYNAALTATRAEKYDKAIEFFTKTKDYNYGGENLYSYLKDIYLTQNDSANALKTLKEGFEKYPQSNTIVVELINFYLKSGKGDQALEYLKVAKEADPQNKTLYFTEGSLLSGMGEYDRAIEAYHKAIEIDKDYFDPYFNLGVLFFNEAVELYNKANETLDNKEYKKYRAEADSMIAKAMEPMESAYRINNKDKDVLETLKTIYYRLQMTDKHDAIVKEIEALKNESAE